MKKIITLLLVLTGMVSTASAQEDTYTVAGSSEALFGTSWDPSITANDMTLVDGVYKWENKVSLEEGNVYFKVVKNHSWEAGNWPSDNYELAIPWTDNYTVTITFDPSNNTVSAVAVAKVEICGDFNNWGSDSPLTLTQQGYTNTYTGVLDLSSVAINQEMKLIYNGTWLDYDQMTVVAPTGWTEMSDETWKNILLKHTITDYLTYDLTATWSNGWTLNIEGKDECPATSYTLMGAFYDGDEKASILGSIWDATNTNNDMINSSGTTYTITYSNVDLTPGNFQFKVAKNYKYVHTYPAVNYQLDIENAGRYNIVVTFDADSKEITATATEVPKTVTSVTLMSSSNSWAEPVATFSVEDPGTGYWTANGVEFAANNEFKVCVNYNYGPQKWLAPESDSKFLVDEKQLNKALALEEETGNMYVNHAMPLSFSMNPSFTELTITCDDVFTIAGTKSLTGTEDDWDIDDSNNMVLNGETGLYEWTANNIVVSADKTYDYKVVKNGTTWIPASINKEITLANIGAAVAGKYNIKITFNAESEAISSTGEKTYEAVPVTNSVNWATTVTNSALDFTGMAIEAYTAKVEGTTVKLTRVYDVKAETGLVIKGTKQTEPYYVPVIESSDTDEGDLLWSSTDAFDIHSWYTDDYYGLAVKEGNKVGFTLINKPTGDDVVWIPAQKAFLAVSTTGARELNVVFEGETTGIETLNAEKATLKGEMYNLAGQKVNKSFKGIVINNGKKAIMK